ALAHAAFKEFNDTLGAFSLFDPQATGFKADRMTITGFSMLSAGIQAAKRFVMDKNNSFSIGLGLNKVMGFQGFSLQSDALQVSHLNGDSLLISPGSITTLTYGDEMGNGYGADIGFTYVFNKKESKKHFAHRKNRTRYFLKTGVSVMDIGRVKYRDAVESKISIQSPGMIIRMNDPNLSQPEITDVLDSI